MAAAEPVKKLKEELTCPICLELFRDTVVGECGHSFCRECIARHCQGDGDVACPLCNEKLRERNLRPNRELKNIVGFLRSQIVKDPSGGNLCERHRQPLQLYCTEDRTLICVVCRESRAHRAHNMAPVEEAVQDHREVIRKHLEGIESGYQKLHQLVSTDWTYLPQSEREEEHQRLQRLTDNVATLLKVHTEGPRQRSDGAESQTQPCDPEARGSPARKDAGETESQEHKVGKQEETGTHVGTVGQKDPTRKHELSQGSQDEAVHKISDTREAVQSEEAEKKTRKRPKDGSSLTPAEGSGGSRTEASSASSEEEGNGAPAGDRKQRNPLLPPTPVPVPEPPHQTEQHSGRKPGSEPAAETQEETGSHVDEETPAPKPELSHGSLDNTISKISGTRGDTEPKVAEKETRKRPLTPAEGSGGSRTDASSASSEEEGAAMGGGTEAAGEGQQRPAKKRKDNEN